MSLHHKSVLGMEIAIVLVLVVGVVVGYFIGMLKAAKTASE